MASKPLLSRFGPTHVFVACAAYFAVYVALILIISARPDDQAMLFGSFWEAGKHLDYQSHPLVWRTAEGFLEINLNPPTLLPLFQIFALFDPQAGQIVWLVVSAALYLAVAWTLRKQVTRAQMFWLMTMPTVYAGLALGQVYVLLFALGAAIWWALKEDRPVLAAILIGLLVAIKPNFAVWVATAFCAGHLRPAVIVAAVAVGLSALAALAYGPHIYSEWLQAVSMDRHSLHPHNASLLAFFTRFGLAGGWVIVSALLIGVLGWAYRVRPTLYDLTPIAILVAILCSPLAWLDYVIVAAPFFIDRPWRAPMVAAAFLIYCSPMSGAAFHSGNPAYLLLASAVSIIPVAMMLGHFLLRATPQRAPSNVHGGLEPA